jgi:hypothetical protein
VTLLTASRGAGTLPPVKRSAAAVLIGLIGAGLFTYELIEVMKIGTCASGGPYVSAQPCPAGTGTKVLLLTLGILLSIGAIFLAGGFTGPGLFVWCTMFLSAGVGLLAYALTGHNVPSGAKLAGYIIGAVFIPMGGLPLIWLVGKGLSGADAHRLKARRKLATATLSRIDELHRYGVNQVRVRLTYSVQPSDEAGFEVSRETNALITQLPKTGQRVNLFYDPRDHNRFEVTDADPARAAVAFGG